MSKQINLLVALLLLAQGAAMAADEAMVWRYTVRPGDNLINLSKRHLINPDDRKIIQRLNRVQDPNYIPAGSTLKIPLILLKQSAAEAEVIQLSGDAFLDNNGVLQKLNQAQKLGPGATLRTLNNSKLTIKFADGTLTSMASNSKLVLDTLSLYSGGAMVDTKLRLQQGQLETLANPKHLLGNTMQIIAPTAIAAVRGTQFRVAAEANAVLQETLDGKVALSAAGDDVLVNKGFGSYANAGAPPSSPVALLAAADTSQLKTQYDQLPVQFDLPEQAGAVAWHGSVYSDKKKQQLLAEANSTATSLVFADLPDGQYYLSVRAKDKNGLSGYDASHTFTVDARPFPPSLTAPAKGVILREMQPALVWEPVKDASAYGIEVARDADFKQVFIKQRVQTNQYQVSQDLTSGQYFWRVHSIALNANGVEDVGLHHAISDFIYKALPPMPNINGLQVSVANNRVIVKAPTPAVPYRYQVVLDNPFNHQKNVWQGDDLQENFTFLLKEYGEQALSIRYIDEDGALGPEATYSFNAPAPSAW